MSRFAYASFGLAVLAAMPGHVVAQAQPAAATGTATAQDDLQAKREIMASPRWRAVRQGLRDWMSVQQIYDQNQLAKIKAELDAEVARMSASELSGLLDQLEAKLKVLTSPEADEARAYVAQYMSVAAAPLREKLKKKLPDPASMTAAQLEQELKQFEMQRTSTQAQQSAFDQARQQQISMAQQARQQQQPQTTSGTTGRSESSFYPSTAARPQKQYYPGYLARPQYSVSPYGGIWRSW